MSLTNEHVTNYLVIERNVKKNYMIKKRITVEKRESARESREREMERDKEGVKITRESVL